VGDFGHDLIPRHQKYETAKTYRWRGDVPVVETSAIVCHGDQLDLTVLDVHLVPFQVEMFGALLLRYFVD
jgi:hypothetical protein